MKLGTGFLVLVLLSSTGLDAKRRPLDPPDSINFRAADHFSDVFRGHLKEFSKLVQKFPSEELQEKHEILWSTLKQPRLLEVVSQIIVQADRYQVRPEDLKQDDDLQSQLRQQAGALKALIANNSYLGPNYPIEVEVDAERRICVVKWRQWTGAEWSGDYVVREVPFVPQLNVVVSATYDPHRKTGTYGYRTENGQDSGDSISELWVESVGLTRERLMKFQKISGSDERIQLENGRYVYVGVPREGYLQDFRLRVFDKSRMTVYVKPGEKLVIPPVLSVPWPQLPAVVRSWVEPKNYKHGLSPHEDPENAVKLFRTHEEVRTPQTGEKSVPVRWYGGKTLGPAPQPNPEVTRQQFLKKIIGYLEEAREWGWTANDAVSDRIEKELQSLTSGPLAQDRILRLVEEVEQAKRQGDLLEEAYVLLKYNLEYLAEEKNWRK